MSFAALPAFLAPAASMAHRRKAYCTSSDCEFANKLLARMQIVPSACVFRLAISARLNQQQQQQQ